jgi:hypothetical protein
VGQELCTALTNVIEIGQRLKQPEPQCAQVAGGH